MIRRKIGKFKKKETKTSRDYDVPRSVRPKQFYFHSNLQNSAHWFEHFSVHYSRTQRLRMCSKKRKHYCYASCVFQNLCFFLFCFRSCEVLTQKSFRRNLFVSWLDFVDFKTRNRKKINFNENKNDDFKHARMQRVESLDSRRIQCDIEERNEYGWTAWSFELVFLRYDRGIRVERLRWHYFALHHVSSYETSCCWNKS